MELHRLACNQRIWLADACFVSTNTAVGATSLGVQSISSSGEYDAASWCSRSVWNLSRSCP